MSRKGFVVPPGGGSVLSMAPGRSAALKLVGGSSPACWYARARDTELMAPWGPGDLTSGQVGLYWFGGSVGL